MKLAILYWIQHVQQGKLLRGGIMVCIFLCMCVCKVVGRFEQYSTIRVVLGRHYLRTLWTGRLSGVSAP